MMPRGGLLGGIPIQIELESAGLAKTSRALKDAAQLLKGTDIGAGLVKSMAKGSKDLSREFSSAAARAASANMASSAQTLTQMRKDWDQTMSQQIATLSQVMKTGTDAQKAAAIEAFKREEKAFEEKFKAEEDLIEKRLKALDEEKRQQKELMAERKKQAEELADMFGKDLADNLGSALGQAKGGDLSGLMGGGGKALEKAALAMGVSAGAMAAVAGAVALVIKLLIDAEAQAKEFNQAMMEGAGFADMAWTKHKDGLEQVANSMDLVRMAAVNLGMEYRTLPKDMMAIVASANAAGLTFKEIERDTSMAGDAARSYSKLLETSLVYSRALGASTTEIAEQSAKWHHDFGMGLKQIEETFAAITQVAMQSGMATKRFFGMVSQATSGMAIYNNRIEETAELLADLATVVGEDLAEALSQDLMKGFMNDSYQERFKRIMVAGGNDVSDVMMNSAQDMSRQLIDGLRDVNDLGSMIGGDLANALMGANTSDDASMQGVVERLGSMNQDQLGQALAKMRLQGNDEMARQLENVVNLARGATGGLDEQAKAMGSLDAGGKLAFQLRSMLGDRALSDASAIELAAFEQYAGISGEQLEALKRVDLALRGQFSELQGMRSENIAANSERDLMLAEQYGATIRDGEIVSAAVVDGQVVTAGVLSDIGDYMQSNGDALQQATELGLDANEARAAEIARQTTSISTILEIGVQYWLEQIHSTMQSVYEAIMHIGPEERRAQEQALQGSRAAQQKALVDLERINQELSENRQAMDQLAGDDAEGRADLKAKEALLLRGKESAQGKIDEQTELQGIIRGTASWITPDNLEELNAEVESELIRRNAPDMIFRQDFMDEKLEEAENVSQFQDPTGLIAAGLNPARYAEHERDRAVRAEATSPMTTALGFVDEEEQAAAVEAGTVEANRPFFEDIIAEEEALRDEVVGGIEDLDDNMEKRVYDALKRDRIDQLLDAAGITDQNLRQGYRNELMAGRMPSDLGDTIEGFRMEKSQSLPPALETLMIQSGQLGFLQGRDLLHDRSLNDFIFRGGANGGTISPIDRADEFLAMKPDGGVMDAMRSMGGGGPSTVNINVRSPQDMEKVYQVVKSAVGHN